MIVLVFIFDDFEIFDFYWIQSWIVVSLRNLLYWNSYVRIYLIEFKSFEKLGKMLCD